MVRLRLRTVGYLLSVLATFCLVRVGHADETSTPPPGEAEQGQSTATAGDGEKPPAKQDESPTAESQQLREEIKQLRRQLAALTARLDHVAGPESGGRMPFRFEVITYIWGQGQPPVKMLHKDEGICFLTRVGFAAGGAVWVNLENDGYYYLNGAPAQTDVISTALGIRFLAAKEPAAPALDGDADQPSPVIDTEEPAGPAEDGLAEQKPDQPRIIKLASTIGRIAVGGGGRYLFLHVERLRKLAVFDVTKEKIVKYISLPGDDVMFTAGQNKLIVVVPSKHQVQRWNLETFEREANQTLQLKGDVKRAVMGSASSGPAVLIVGADSFQYQISLLNLDSLEVTDLLMPGGRLPSVNEGTEVWASADGSVFGIQSNRGSPSGMATIVLRGDSAQTYYDHTSSGYVIPSADGHLICTAVGLFTPELKAVAMGQSQQRFCLPAAQPSFLLEFERDRIGRRGVPAPRPSLISADEFRLLLTLPSLDELSSEQEAFASPLGAFPFWLDQQVFFMPDAKRLITVPAVRDSLYVRTLDIQATLDQNGADYLFVMSVPNRVATSGEQYKYTLAVASNRQPVEFTLDSGPEGMTISATGTIEWNVPRDLTAGETTGVITIVRDSSGQSLQHAYELVVQ